MPPRLDRRRKPRTGLTRSETDANANPCGPLTVALRGRLLDFAARLPSPFPVCATIPFSATGDSLKRAWPGTTLAQRRSSLVAAIVRVRRTDVKSVTAPVRCARPTRLTIHVSGVTPLQLLSFRRRPESSAVTVLPTLSAQAHPALLRIIHGAHEARLVGRVCNPTLLHMPLVCQLFVRVILHFPESLSLCESHRRPVARQIRALRR